MATTNLTASVLAQMSQAQAQAQYNQALNNQVISGTSSLPILGPNILTSQAVQAWPPGIAGSTGRPARPPTKRYLAMQSLRSVPERKLDKVSMHYKHISPDTVINTLGHFPPVMNNRPTKWVLPLLCCASAPHRFTGQLDYKLAGLTFVSQANPLGKFCKMRLTVAGYELLVHYSKSEKFKAFFDAFVSKKAKDEIYAACFDFEMNAIPEFIQKDGMLMAERKAKKDASIIQFMRQYAASQGAVYTSPSQSWMASVTNTLIGSAPNTQTAYNGPINQLAMSIRQTAPGLPISVNGTHIYVTDGAGNQHLVWKPS